MVGLYQVLDYGKAESCTTGVAGTGPVHTVEAFEYAGEALFGDTDAGR